MLAVLSRKHIALAGRLSALPANTDRTHPPIIARYCSNPIRPARITLL
ncbi:hypothetical protein J2X20_000915 [Pelomonas saccharophila]|uniref:Uncharacterized protein n=1 Tax=Roseateles saccharophilus TaxID=304 RepID=A0ABU1YJU5_ROSSA|nr:hypothetical protein [Roseateles saccharophilus]